MPCLHVLPSGTVQFAALISIAALLLGCSESNDALMSGAASDSSTVKSEQNINTTSGAVTDLPGPSNEATSEVAIPQPAGVSPAKDIAATIPTPEPVADSPAAAKPGPKPIYVEEPNGKELIAAALKEAQRDHKHVLIEWGGNWCGWCYKLHDVFHNDPEVRPIVYEEFELVLIDSRTNTDLMHEYGGEDRQYSFPHLTVLDEHGEVLTNQETGSLEEGPKHDPKLVSQFLLDWVPAKIDAEQLLTDTLKKAADEDKRVLIRVGTPYCGWCRVLAQFILDHESLFSADYIDTKIDTMRMTNGDQVAARFEPEPSGGVPWMVILDASGEQLASSFGPDGNIGYPFQSGEIAHFMTMLRATRKRLSDASLSTIEADLNAYREKREAKQ